MWSCGGLKDPQELRVADFYLALIDCAQHVLVCRSASAVQQLSQGEVLQLILMKFKVQAGSQRVFSIRLMTISFHVWWQRGIEAGRHWGS